MPLRDAALLLLGHGSTLNADSSAPTYQHAEEIRRRKIFAEVHVAFWKEEPNFRQALRQTSCRHIYVVPNFISSGYFTEQVIPRELSLDGPITHRDNQHIFYCPPVGLHPAMTEALLRRANEVVAQSEDTIAAPAKTACLFICGHGTTLNDNSTKIIHDQAEIIRAKKIYADCQPVLMEQKPFVKNWRTLTSRPDVIVVPFFISDGLHSYEDIPVLLGLTHSMKEKSFTNPHLEDGRRLWYASAIGTEAFMADVIIAQAQQFEREHAETRKVTAISAAAVEVDLAGFLAAKPGPWKIGEVIIRREKNGAFELRHADDLTRGPTKLRLLAAPEDLRELIRLDRKGNFRPLRAAPNVRNGWRMSLPDVAGLHAALDYLYPAELANWLWWKSGELPATPWHETAKRQTGRFRVVREIDDAAAQKIVATLCQKNCLKQRLWSPAAQKITGSATEVPLLCPEACNYFVGKAREKIKGPGEE